MSRATILQAAFVVELVIVMLILLGAGVREPQHQTTYRPATEQERRQSEQEQLYEELLRQQQEAN